MLNIFNAKSAKQSARVLERFMKAKGFDLKRGEALEALGQMSGNKNWSALSKALTEETVNPDLSAAEIAHIFDAGDADIRAEETGEGGYGRESALVVHTGYQLRYPAYREGNELLDYVRVCDPLGREIAYWIFDEWSEDPQLVMGAIFGALARGRAVEFDNKKSATADSGPIPAVAEKPVPQPSITDVPWTELTAVLLNEQYFSVRYAEFAELDRLATAPEPDEDAEAEATLALGREEDGLVFDAHVTLDTLRRLAWDASKKAFVDPLNKDEYKFILARQFGV